MTPLPLDRGVQEHLHPVRVLQQPHLQHVLPAELRPRDPQVVELQLPRQHRRLVVLPRVSRQRVSAPELPYRAQPTELEVVHRGIREPPVPLRLVAAV